MTSKSQRPPRDGELTAVYCWCERSIQHVDIIEIRKGRTRTCGRSDCKPS
jgi:hypothetical protein